MKLQIFSETSSFVDTIERVVRSRTNGMIRGLHVSMVNGEIVISGRASTYYAKQLATHAVRDTDKDVILTNDIEVC